MLIVFGGLPATGKTTLAQALAQALGATYLRIDTIEQALRGSGALAGDVGPAGYVVGYALAAENLRLGRTVVADSVNPLRITRDAWRAAGIDAGVTVVEVEVICSDPAEHRHRVTTRIVDVPGLVPPGWAEIVAREYHAWDRTRVVIDTAGRAVADTVAELRAAIAEGTQQAARGLVPATPPCHPRG